MTKHNKTVQDADADIFTAIAHPVRRQILDLLAEREMTVTHLTEPFQISGTISRPAISQHLKILLDAKLVGMREEGRQNFYFLLPEKLQEVQIWLTQFEQFWQKKLNTLEEYLRNQNPE
jgi:DNA-binding transcriptional ArsR family regulator